MEGRQLVFVEVRYRADERFGGSLASVTREKRRRLLRAARAYLSHHPALARRSCRFDVVAVSGAPDSPSLRWLRNAFDAD